jgi:glycogen debranching enzyme
MATTTQHPTHHTQRGKDDHKDTAKDNNETEKKQKQGQDQLATTVGDIRSATTTKYNQVFMLTDNGGNFTPERAGYGLYFRDTQYLDHWELQISGQHLIPLLSDSSRGTEARMELTNPKMTLPSGETLVKERLSIKRVQTLHHHCTDVVSVRNMRQDPVDIDLTLTYGSHFTSMFVVRGHKPGKRGTLNAPKVKGHTVELSYAGADGHQRSVTITCSQPPDALDESHATYHLKLKPRATHELRFTLDLADVGPHAEHHAGTAYSPKSATDQHQSFDQALHEMPDVSVNNSLFDRALTRSLDDIRMLATTNGDDIYVSAGVPWYVALFGRDSCIAAYEVLAFQPHLARTTLEVLARYQGTKDADFQDEEPGKISHELRLGEMANLHEVPMFPYYGSVDSTPWFLMLMGAYVRWTGDLDLFHTLEKNVDRALAWIDHNIATGLKGFVTYGSRSESGLKNHGWKDSGNSIVNTDGTLCEPPIALVEVQGYVYDAWLQIAHLKRATGDDKGAKALEAKAVDLRERFNKEFWIPKREYYGFCIERSRQLIRTLSSEERAYNPLDYQVGSIWPHDNALIALGLRRAGFVQELESVFTGIFDAATLFSQFRLPEVFDGFSRQQYDKPVNYPVACSPQAWAAGALPLLLTAALGLEPSALERRLTIERPHLPIWMTSVAVKGLRVGDMTVDLRYERKDDTTLVAVERRDGDLEVIVRY